MTNWVLSNWASQTRRASGVLIALGLGGLIALSRLLLQDALGPKSPFILASPAIMVAAFFGGFWPAMGVSAIALWVGLYALAAGGEPTPRPGVFLIYFAFALVFAAAGEMRQRGLRRARDDAERLREMQDRLARVARLNALGEMVGTLAHELNQPLTAIASYAGAAQRLVDRDDGRTTPVIDLLQKIAVQAVRAREIISRVRGQVSRSELALAPHSLSGMFRDSATVATAGLERPPTIRTDFDAGADLVMVDRTQIEQVMVNLIRNAAEAMTESRRREVRLAIRPAEDGYAEARVADTGSGLSPEVTENLFQPFVTGKPEGMGMGLAISRGIVEAHGGKIWAERCEDGGAVFAFTLRTADGGPP